MQMQLIHAAACVALFLLAQVTSGARLREHANNRALVVVDETRCTGDCTSATAGATRDAPLATQESAVPEFVPTHEWKDILPNQALPPRLYIRINMETGKKEAKLLN